MRRIAASVFFILTLFILPSCKTPIEYLFPVVESVVIEATLDYPAGRYNPMPILVKFTFPTDVSMASVDDSDFSVTDTCAGSTVTLAPISKTGYITDVGIVDVVSCVNAESMTITVSNTGIELTDEAKKTSGSKSYTYTYDDTAPSVSAAFAAVSGVTVSGSYGVSSVPSSVTYSFSSDIDLTTVTAGDFTVVSAGGTDCSTLPTIGTLTKSSSASTVRVALTGASCADGESFRLTLLNSSVTDKTMDGTTGLAAGNVAPATDIEIDIIKFDSVPAVESVGDLSTSADATYKIGDTIDIQVKFDASVEVTGTPRLRLNISAGGATRYALYSSGSASDTLTFQYTVASPDTVAELDYSSTSALELNGGTITRDGSNGALAATRTLASPGAANSIGSFRDIVIDGTRPTITTSSPTTDFSTGADARDVTFTFSEELDAGTVADTDLSVVAGTCVSPPTITGSSLGGASNNVVTFSIGANTCGDDETFTLSIDPADVTDLNGNAGSGSVRNLIVTVQTDKPTLVLSAPSKTYVTSADTLTYTATYSGAATVTLGNSDINFTGASTGCNAVVSGSGTTTRTITIDSCSDNGAVMIDVLASSAINVYGNLADAVDESVITDFTADNLELPDPTLDLPTIVSDKIYNEDTLSSFGLVFTGDVLGTNAAVLAALDLNCDNGSGANPVTISGTRTNDTDYAVTPTEGSPDFVYNASCTIAGTNVPDAAGNLHTFVGLPFKVSSTPTASSGPNGTVSISTATSAGELDNVVFNVSMDPATIITANVTLTCASQDVGLSSLNTTASDTTVTIDFDETDADWTSLVGGESCVLSFSTSVTNSHGIPLTTTTDFSFTTSP